MFLLCFIIENQFTKLQAFFFSVCLIVWEYWLIYSETVSHYSHSVPVFRRNEEDTVHVKNVVAKVVQVSLKKSLKTERLYSVISDLFFRANLS